MKNHRTLDDLFDPIRANREKNFFMEMVERHNEIWVKNARNVALMLAARNGEVTINDVLKLCPIPLDHEGNPVVHQNAIGAVMKTKQLKRIGETISDKVSSHARRIGVYTLCV